MDLPKCPKCGKDIGMENFFIHSMTVQCPACGYSGAPAKTAPRADNPANILKHDAGAPYDPFASDMSLQAISSRIALAGLFLTFVFVWFPELRAFAAISFSAFILFSAMFGFLKFRGA